MNRTDPDTLALRNLRWLAEYRRKQAAGFRAIEPHTLAERHQFELRQAVKLSRIRFWLRSERALRYVRVPPPPPSRAAVIPFRFRPRNHQRTA